MNIMQKINKLYHSSLKELLFETKDRISFYNYEKKNIQKFNYIKEILKEKFSIYKTDNLINFTTEEFKNYIFSKLNQVDFNVEGFSEQEVPFQRDLTIKFTWGHNHDFGEFQLKGRMEDRHIDVLCNFILYFDLPIDFFENKKILDIGCWTGGTSILLVALKGDVLAIEEVKKYAEIVGFLSKAFNLTEKLKVKSISLYELHEEEFFNVFDIAYFPGVIYHVSDPVIALRIIYNTLKIGGTILIETEGISTPYSYCKFEGCHIHTVGNKEELSRGGWNWFIPSRSALQNMMINAGFKNIKTIFNYNNNRIYAIGEKTCENYICQAGLSKKIK